VGLLTQESTRLGGRCRGEALRVRFPNFRAKNAVHVAQHGIANTSHLSPANRTRNVQNCLSLFVVFVVLRVFPKGAYSSHNSDTPKRENNSKCE